MKLSTFMTAAAVLAFVFGLAFFLVPVQLLAIYGTPLDPADHLIGRYFGTALLGFGVLNWLARNQATRTVLLADFVVSVTGLFVALWGALYGEGNALVWTTVIFYLFLTLGSGYYSFMRQGSVQLAVQR